jgi:hypothetical protein
VRRSISDTDRLWQRILLGVIVVALAVRVGWVAWLPVGEQYLSELPDQLEYLQLGRNLLEGRGLVFFDERFNDEVWAFRMPGYPLFVAALGGSVRAIRLAQALIDTSAVLAVYLLARRWLGRGTSVFAAAIVAGNPFLIFFTGLVLSETAFISMLVWGMALLVVAGGETSARGPDGPARPVVQRWASVIWWSGAIILALSITVRPSALALPILLGVVAAVANRGMGGPYLSRWVPPVATSILLLQMAVLLPWGYRNYRVLGSWVWTTTNSGITLYDGFNPDATGASDQTFVRLLPRLRGMNEVQRSEYLADRAWQYIRSHRRRAVELAAVKVMRTWSPVPLSGEYGTRRNVLIASIYMIPFYLLIVAGLWFGTPPTSAKVFLLLPAIYFTAVHAMSVGSLRYRVPADVPMAVVAAASIALVSRLERIPDPPAQSG